MPLNKETKPNQIDFIISRNNQSAVIFLRMLVKRDNLQKQENKVYNFFSFF